MNQKIIDLQQFVSGKAIDYSKVTDFTELKSHWQSSYEFPRIQELIMKRMLEILPAALNEANIDQLLSWINKHLEYYKANILIEARLVEILPQVLSGIKDFKQLARYSNSVRTGSAPSKLISDQISVALQFFSSIEELHAELEAMQQSSTYLSEGGMSRLHIRENELLEQISEFPKLLSYWRPQPDGQPIKSQFMILVESRVETVLAKITDLPSLLSYYQQTPSLKPLAQRITNLLPSVIPLTEDLSRLMDYLKIIRRYKEEFFQSPPNLIQVRQLIDDRLNELLPDNLPLIGSMPDLFDYYILTKGLSGNKLIEIRLIELLSETLPDINDVEPILAFSQQIKKGLRSSYEVDKLLAARLEKIIKPLFLCERHYIYSNFTDVCDLLPQAANGSAVRAVIWHKAVEVALASGLVDITIMWNWLHSSDSSAIMLQAVKQLLENREPAIVDLMETFTAYKKITREELFHTPNSYNSQLRSLIGNHLAQILQLITKENIPNDFIAIIKGNIPEGLEKMFKNKAMNLLN
ncbi:MAG: hypothetical protein WC453_03710 [Patescibacteria group bacterium]